MHRLHYLRRINRLFRFGLSDKYSICYYSNNYFRSRKKNFSHVKAYVNLSRLFDNKFKLTKKMISLFDNQPFSISPGKVKKIYGKPNSKTYVNHYSYEILILFYRVNVGGINGQLELHFSGKELFLYNYTLFDMDKRKYAMVKNVFETKYLQCGTVDFSSEVIKDKDGAVIFLEDELYLSLTYINNCDFIKSIPTYVEKEKEKMKKKLISNKKEIYRKL